GGRADALREGGGGGVAWCGEQQRRGARGGGGAARAGVGVRLGFSLLAVVASGQGDFLRPFVDASLPFERYARPFGDHARPSWVGPTLESSDEACDRHLRPRFLWSYAFWPGFPRRFFDFRSCACSRFPQRFLPLLSYYLLLPPYCYLYLCFR